MLNTSPIENLAYTAAVAR